MSKTINFVNPDLVISNKLAIVGSSGNLNNSNNGNRDSLMTLSG